MQDKKFNKKEYDLNYRKNHAKARIVIDVSFEEKERITNILKKNNLTYVEAFKQKIEELDSKK